MIGHEVFVCIKPAVLIEGPAHLREKNMDLDPSCIRYFIDPGNACALESALAMRDRREVDSVTCLTAGTKDQDSVLQWCMAAGANRVLRADLPEGVILDAMATGLLLASVIRSCGGVLVLTGQLSSDECSGLVAAALAADLGAAYLSNAVDVQLQKGEISIKRKVERGHRQLWSAELPVVVALAPGANRPRYVSVAGLALASRIPVEVVTPGELFLQLNELPRLTERVRLSKGRVRTRQSGLPDTAGTAAERMQALMNSGGSSGHGKKILTGSIDELAGYALDMIEDRGLLPPGRD
jgi:electron transfer flavoprotein beta subunit